MTQRRITLFYTALFLSGFVQAQVTKESYEKAVDLLNCKTIELSLQGNENLLKFQKECQCDKVNYTQINSFLISAGKLEATTALSSEVESLKKTFKENWKKDDVIAFLSENIFSDKTKYKKIYAFAEKRKGKPEFNNYKTSLKKDLAASLVEINPQEKVESTVARNQQSTLDESNTEIENNQNTDEDDNGFLGALLGDVLIILSILLGIGALFLGLRKPSGQENEVSSVVENYVRKQINDTNSNINTPNNSYGSAELRDANNRIRDLETQIEKIKTQLGNFNPVSNYSPSAIQKADQQEVISQNFFLSTPNSDGSFNESSASPAYKEGATIYRFTKIGHNKAKFQIDEKDASAKLALQFPDKNIDPVCEAVNAFNPKATQIKTVEPGEAELQNGKWIVEKNKKAKIKYEN
jgi:hypothetical protein